MSADQQSGDPARESGGLIDSARPIREGEEFDLVRLQAHLVEQLGDDFATLSVEQFPGGHSNLTYLLRTAEAEYVLRRPPFGSKVARAHDMGREHRVLSALSPHKNWAPKPLLFCDDHDVIGADFYVMERIRGIILRRKVPKELTIDESRATVLCESLLDTLVELHALDYQDVGLGELGRPEGYVERQVTGWSARYDKSQTDAIEEMPRIAKWLQEHIPTSPPATVIHNDFKFDNVIFGNVIFGHVTPGSSALDEIVGVLDWEMATVGDPLMDLGTMLCYWVQDSDPAPLKSFSFGPTSLPGMFTRQQLVERYADKTGRDVSDIVFYFTFGLFKTAVVIQQIYYRYKNGLTQDPRFAMFIEGVRLLALTADRAVATNSIA